MIKTIASGFQFPEGPVFDENGLLYVCDVQTHSIYKVDVEKRTKTLWLHFDGQPNGATRARNNRDLLVADSLHGRILQIAPDGSPHILFEDPLLYGPNDLTVDDRGVIYFTDPTWLEGHEQIPQYLYALSPDGSLAKFGPFHQPNGIKYKNGRLFLAEGGTGIIWHTRPAEMNFSEWGIVANKAGKISHALDGLEIDRAGRVYVAAYDLEMIAVFDSYGNQLPSILLPGSCPTNLEFDQHESMLFVTEAKHGRVLSVSPFETSQPAQKTRPMIDGLLCCI